MGNLKIMVIGQGRHGKDTAAEYMAEILQTTFVSSSAFINEKVVFPLLKKKYGYKTLQECYDDRHSHRVDWYNIIHNYNTPKLHRLVAELYAEHDIYCGLRHKLEFDSAKAEKLFDICIWVDAEERLGITETTASMTLTKKDADIIIYNNTTEKEFKIKIKKAIEGLIYDRNIERKA